MIEILCFSLIWAILVTLWLLELQSKINELSEYIKDVKND